MANISESEKDVATEARRSPANPAGRPLWEVIDEIMRDVPKSVLNRLPADGAERHDHYLSGTLKETQPES